jgi:hypothetical protein
MASYVSYLWLRAISFPAQCLRRFGEIVCHYFPRSLIERGDKFDPRPLIRSLLHRSLPPRSFELPKSCRECPTISQSAFPPARPPFIKQFCTPVSPQRSSRYTWLLIDVSSIWLASASTGVSKVCANSQGSHGILNSIPRAAAMYVTRSESMHISSSTDTTLLLSPQSQDPSPSGEQQYKDVKTKRHGKR